MHRHVTQTLLMHFLARKTKKTVVVVCRPQHPNGRWASGRKMVVLDDVVMSPQHWRKHHLPPSLLEGGQRGRAGVLSGRCWVGRGEIERGSVSVCWSYAVLEVTFASFPCFRVPPVHMNERVVRRLMLCSLTCSLLLCLLLLCVWVGLFSS